VPPRVTAGTLGLGRPDSIRAGRRSGRNTSITRPLTVSARKAPGFTFTVLLDLRFDYVRAYMVKQPALTGIELTSLGFPASFANSVF